MQFRSLGQNVRTIIRRGQNKNEPTRSPSVSHAKWAQPSPSSSYSVVDNERARDDHHPRKSMLPTFSQTVARSNLQEGNRKQYVCKAKKIMHARCVYLQSIGLLLVTFISFCKPQSPFPTSLTDCLSVAQVPVSLPSTANFSLLSAPYNLRLQYTPAVIILPASVEEVSSAVLCAAGFGVKVQAKSGGHS